jgi:hypothetical protein
MSGMSTIEFKAQQMIVSAPMTSSISSNVVDLQNMEHVAIQAIYTGSPNGVLKLQTSCDLVSDGSSVVNWTDLNGDSVTITTAGSTIFRHSGLGDRWIKAVYTFSSGTGTLNVNFSGKG